MCGNTANQPPLALSGWGRKGERQEDIGLASRLGTHIAASVVNGTDEASSWEGAQCTGHIVEDTGGTQPSLAVTKAFWMR